MTFAKYLSLALAAGALFFTGCSDSVVNDYSDAKATATVNFLVRDSYTGNAIDSISITRLSYDTLTKYTDSTGYARFQGVKIGTYVYRLDKTGYATVLLDQTVADLSGDVPRVPDVNLDLQIPKTGAQVQGRAFYNDQNGNSVAIEGATIQLTLGALGNFRWLHPILTTTTDADGNYSFTDLPEGVDYSISSRQITIADKVYSAGTPVTVSGVYSGESQKADPIVLTILGNPLHVSSTNFWGSQQVGTTDSIVLNFTEPVDVSRIQLSDIIVYESGFQVLVNASWSNTNKALTLTPVDGSWWNGVVHTIHLALISEDNVDLTAFDRNTFTPGLVNGLPGNVSNLKATFAGNATTPNSTTNTINLKWSPATDAQGYYICIKNTSDSAFIITDQATDTSATITQAGIFSKGNIVAIRIISYNTLGTSDVGNANTITLVDGVKPTVTGLPVAFTVNTALLKNTAGTTDLALTRQQGGMTTLTFDETMDTTATPSITIPAANSTTIKYVWKWTSTTQATLQAFVIAGQDASAMSFTATIDLSVLKDEAGNALSYAAGADTISFNIP